MGNLVDTFLISLKHEWRNMDWLVENGKYNRAVLEAIPVKYRNMMECFMREESENTTCIFWSLKELIANYNLDRAYKIIQKYGLKWSDFDARYRKNCFRQMLRRTFFNTLVIIRNDNNPDKCNRYYVSTSDEVITEQEWKKEKPDDQVFLHKVFEIMREKGYDIHTIDGIHYIKKHKEIQPCEKQ